MRPARLFTALALIAAMTAPAMVAPGLAQTGEARDDQAARIAMASRLTASMQLDRQFEAVIPSIVGIIMPLVVKDNGGKEQQLREIIAEEMNRAFITRRQEMVDSARDVYAESFTLAQLTDMLAFYTSPTGKVFVDKMPAITMQQMQRGGVIGQKAAADALPKIFDRMRAAQMTVPKGV